MITFWNSRRKNDFEAQVEIDISVKWVGRCDSVVVRRKMIKKSIRKALVRARVWLWPVVIFFLFNRTTLNNRSKIFQMAATVYEKEICSANILSCSGPQRIQRLVSIPNMSLQWLILQANHGGCSHPGTQLGTQKKDFDICSSVAQANIVLCLLLGQLHTSR